MYTKRHSSLSLYHYKPSYGGTVVEEREKDRTQLYDSEEMFLCGSSAEIMPIISNDGISIGI